MRKFADVLQSGDWKAENMCQQLLRPNQPKQISQLRSQFTLARIFPIQTRQSTTFAG